jgi:phosphatidylserine synthase 2
MRIICQFSPYNWTEYNWRPMASFRHWVIVLTIILVYSLSEIGTFYLKYILWVPPPHILVVGRLFFLLLASAIAMREGFDYLDNP